MAENPTADEELPVIARFDVRRRFYLAPDGAVLRPLPGFASDTALLIALYRAMVQARAFDLKAVSLQRTGRLGTYAVEARGVTRVLLRYCSCHVHHISPRIHRICCLSYDSPPVGA
jgi:hypothetical protein